MQIYNLFPIPVIKFELGRDFTSEEMTFVDSQPTHKNMGNTTSDDRYVLKHWTMTSLKKFADDCVSEYFKTVYAPKNEVSLRLTQSWLNYTKPGEFHHKHAHQNSFVSGVLYIKADRNKDKIYFYRDGYERIKISTETFNPYNSESWWFDVGTGDLMLFPSSLTHMVEPVEKDERVSLAFNTFPVGYVGEESSLTALHLKDN